MKQTTILFSLVLLAMCQVPVLGAGKEPVAWWKFDDIEVVQNPVEMVRGETFVPREVLSYATESISGRKDELKASPAGRMSCSGNTMKLCPVSAATR
jgi:hypothetical protein